METKTKTKAVAKKSVAVAAVQNSPAALLSQAIEKGVDVEALQKLMDMQVAWEKKEAAKAFKFSMTEFQANKPVLKRTAEVKYNTSKGTTNYNFNPLPKIQQSIDKVISEYGISYRWEQFQENNQIAVTCVVSHIDGHEERTTLSAMADTSGNKNAIQPIGPPVSYLDRNGSVKGKGAGGGGRRRT